MESVVGAVVSVVVLSVSVVVGGLGHEAVVGLDARSNRPRSAIIILDTRTQKSNQKENKDCGGRTTTGPPPQIEFSQNFSAYGCWSSGHWFGSVVGRLQFERVADVRGNGCGYISLRRCYFTNTTGAT